MDPYNQMQQYNPGHGAQSWTISTTPSSPSTALTEGWWYEIRCTVAATLRQDTLTTAVSTSGGEYLPSDEWSLSFQALSGKVLGVKGTASGTAYLRRVGFGAR